MTFAPREKTVGLNELVAAFEIPVEGSNARTGAERKDLSVIVARTLTASPNRTCTHR